MIAALSLPVRRLIAVGVLLAVLGVLWGSVLQPLSGAWAEARQHNRKVERLLDAYRQVLRDRPRWEAVAKEIQGERYRRIFLNGEDVNLAGAKFQAEVKRSVESAGGTIQSIQQVPVARDRDLRRVGVRLSFSAPLEVVFKLLRKSEQQTPFLFVDDLAITVAEGDPNGKVRPPRLTVRGEFSAYMHPEAP